MCAKYVALCEICGLDLSGALVASSTATATWPGLSFMPMHLQLCFLKCTP